MTLPHQPEARPSVLPAVIGLFLAGLLILALGFWTATRKNQDPPIPTVTLVRPSADTTVDGALTLEFRTGRKLSLQPAGWGSGRYHLHALVNGSERMPAPADIRSMGGDRYSWVLSALPDSAQIQLVWALPNHQRRSEGASRAIQVSRRLP